MARALRVQYPGAVCLSRFMQTVSGSYATYYNPRHRRAGHLAQGRFGAQLVEAEEYLHQLSRCVHLNPVFTKSTKNLGLHPAERLGASAGRGPAAAPPGCETRSRMGRVSYFII